VSGTALDYSFEPLRPEMEEAYARLFVEDAAEKSAERIRWRFDRNPAGRGWFAVARDNGRIIGFVGIYATPMIAGGRQLTSFQAVDLVVDPGYRGRGVFARLGETLLSGARDAGAQVVWGFPNDLAAHAWFGRFSWVRFGVVPLLIRPLRSGYFLRRISSALGKLDVTLIGRSQAQPRIVELHAVGAQLDRLWAQMSKHVHCGVVRDSTWLKWRLEDRPESNYRSVMAVDADDWALAFVSTSTAQRHGARLVYVMEAMSSDGASETLTGLLRHELRRAAELGADAALAWCPPGAPNRAAYRRAGFLSLPSRLRPFNIHFGAKPLAGDLPPELSEGQRWYVSYLDSDTV